MSLIKCKSNLSLCEQRTIKKIVVTQTIFIKHFYFIFYIFVQKKKFITAPNAFFVRGHGNNY